ncbi:MAG: hypothetical protein OHK0032_06140 [Thermodesulfovibrionales bacterium]
MRRAANGLMVFIGMVSLLLLQGCTTDRHFVKKDGLLLSNLKVVRYETPGILRSTMAETFFLTTAAVALPGGSALLVLSDEYAKARGEKMQVKIPDFGYLVMDKFARRLKRERPDWPVLTVVEKPLKEEFTEPCTLIEIRVKRLAYGYLDFIRGGGNGFLSKTVITMKDPEGDVLWQKSFTYLSKDFNRDRDVDEFEADDGKLLKEELEFAAEKTVSEFFKHLKGEDSVAEVVRDRS